MKKEGIFKESEIDQWKSYIYYPPTNQLIAEQQTHQVIIFENFEKLDFLSDDQKKALKDAGTERIQFAGSSAMYDAFETMKNTCITMDKAGKSLTIALPKKDKNWLIKAQDLLLQLRIASGRFEVIQFADNSDGFSNKPIYEFLSVSNWKELEYVFFANDLDSRTSKIRKHKIIKLSGVLKVPPKMEEDLIYSVKFAYSYFVGKFGRNKFPKVDKPKDLIIKHASKEGMVIKIPVNFNDWYFKESEDELFDKLFQVQGWEDGDDTHIWDEGAVTLIFDLRNMSEDSYNADYDHRTKILTIRPAEIMFNPIHEEDYKMKENELLSISLHEATHFAQNIFDTISKFDYPGKSGVGPKDKYEVLERKTILEPKELHPYIREAIEEFKSKREEYPDEDIKKVIQTYLYYWLPDKIHRLRLNPEVWRIFLKKFYEEVIVYERSRLGMKKETSYVTASELREIKKMAKKTSYKEKRKEESGNITYVYDEKHVEERTKKKSGQVEKLRKSIPKVRVRIKKDLSSSDPAEKFTALAAALIDETYERVGNKKSAEENKHYGVTRWLVKHITFSGGKAKIKYVGKSGVNQEKEVSDSKVISVLKEACEGKSKEDRVFEWEGFMVNRKKVNAYLKAFDITTKDIRGFHANDEMIAQLKKAKSGSLPKDEKEKKDKLKEQFTEALEETAKIVGHEISTLKNQYLVPNLESTFMESGKIINSLNSLFRTYDIQKYAGEISNQDRAIDISDRLIRLGNHFEKEGLEKYAEKIDGLINCPFGGKGCK